MNDDCDSYVYLMLHYYLLVLEFWCEILSKLKPNQTDRIVVRLALHLRMSQVEQLLFTLDSKSDGYWLFTS